MTTRGGRAASNPAAGKREQNKANKQRRILQAARELFELKGFDATTTAEISERAGVGTGTLYLYVSSKEQLLVEVFNEDIGAVWADAFASVDPTAPLLDEIVSLFSSVSEYHSRHPKVAAIYFLELSTLLADESDGIGEMMQTIFHGIEAVLAADQVAGRLDERAEPATLARVLFAVWNFEMVVHYSRPDTTDATTRNAIQRSLTAAITGYL